MPTGAPGRPRKRSTPDFRRLFDAAPDEGVSTDELMGVGGLDPEGVRRALADCEAALIKTSTADDREMMKLARSSYQLALGRIKEGWDDYEAAVRVANPDAQGEAQVSWRTGDTAKGATRFPGVLDLQASVGIALYPDHGDDAAGLLRNAEIAAQADVQQRLGKAVDRVNAELSVVEKVRRFIVADAPFAIENEQLTPSMKIPRHVLKAAYGDRLDALYRK